MKYKNILYETSKMIYEIQKGILYIIFLPFHIINEHIKESYYIISS